MLDFAILIALYYCELNFIERIIPVARQLKPFTPAQEEALKANRWSEIGIQERFGVVIDRLDRLQKSQETTMDIYSASYRDKNRKGLTVFSW